MSRVERPVDAAATAPDQGTAAAESTSPEFSGGAHFPALDGYRALAVLFVLLTHVAFITGTVYAATWGGLLARLDIGVTLFFLLSGFLLYRPWARAALESRPVPRLRVYARRRAARILPAYWVMVVASLLLVPNVVPVDPSTWWQHLLALQIYVAAPIADGLAQTWSLCTEIAFYLALPLFGAVALDRSRRSVSASWTRQWVVLATLAAVGVAFNLVRLTTEALPLHSGYWLIGYLDWFAVGMGLAVLEVRSRLPDPPAAVRRVLALAHDPVSCFLIAGSLFLVASSPVGGPYDLAAPTAWQAMAKHLLYVMAAAAFLLPGIFDDGGTWARLLSRPGPQGVGRISYGVFLWHMMLLWILMPVLGIPWFTGRPVVVAAALIPVSLLVATLSYVLVERPSQRWSHRQ